MGDQLGRRHEVQTWGFAEEYRQGERQKGYREMMMDRGARGYEDGRWKQTGGLHEAELQRGVGGKE